MSVEPFSPVFSVWVWFYPFHGPSARESFFPPRESSTTFCPNNKSILIHFCAIRDRHSAASKSRNERDEWWSIPIYRRDRRKWKSIGH